MSSFDGLVQHHSTMLINVEFIWPDPWFALTFSFSRQALGPYLRIAGLIMKGSYFYLNASLFFRSQLFKMGMYGPEFVWILNPEAGTVKEWLDVVEKTKKSNNLTNTCTREQYQAAVNRSFILQGGMARAYADSVTYAGLVSEYLHIQEPITWSVLVP